MSLKLLLLFLAVSTWSVEAQRRRTQDRNNNNNNPPPAVTKEDPSLGGREDNPKDIGPDFPYRRGDTPIFNFDVGDEVFINTIPDLTKSVYHMVDVVVEQRQHTDKFGGAIENCELCRWNEAPGGRGGPVGRDGPSDPDIGDRSRPRNRN